METKLIEALDYIIALCEGPDNPPAYDSLGVELLLIFIKHGINDIELLATDILTALTQEDN